MMGLLKFLKVTYKYRETTRTANTESAIADLSLEYGNTYKDGTVIDENGMLTYPRP